MASNTKMCFVCSGQMQSTSTLKWAVCHGQYRTQTFTAVTTQLQVSPSNHVNHGTSTFLEQIYEYGVMRTIEEDHRAFRLTSSHRRTQWFGTVKLFKTSITFVRSLYRLGIQPYDVLQYCTIVRIVKSILGIICQTCC
jgi:hypothetical protein